MPSQKRCLGGPSFQGSLGKTVRAPPFPNPSLLSALLGCVQMGWPGRTGIPRGGILGVEFVWGFVIVIIFYVDFG